MGGFSKPMDTELSDYDDIIDLEKKTDEDLQKFKLPAEKVRKLQNAIRRKDEFPLEETKTLNILFVGRTRSGKSTAIGVLKDPCYEPKDMSLFSDTVDPKYQSFALDDKKSGIKWTVNIIDTPGLKEVKSVTSEMKARSDDTILGTITYCLKNEITKINALLIFVSFELGITSDDIDCFRLYYEKFYHSDVKIIICVTRAEDKDQSWKDRIVSQLKEHEFFMKMIERENVVIRFLGCIDKDAIDSATEDTTLIRKYTAVYQLRKLLLEELFSATSQVKLLDLPISSSKRINMLSILDDQMKIISTLEEVKDYSMPKVHLAVESFAGNIDYMIDNQSFLNDPEIHERFTAMKSKMRDLCLKLPEKLKTEFVGKVVL